jgi:hypothetical protein
MDREIKKRVKRHKRRWKHEQAQRAEEAERWGDTKQLDISRILSGRGFRKKKPIKDDKGELLVTQEQQLKRWEEYFFNKDKDKKTQSTKEENEDIRIKLTPQHTQRLKGH